MKTIQLNVMSAKSISDAIRDVKERKRWLDERTREFVEELHQVGVDEAAQMYTEAVIAGDIEADVDDDPHITRIRRGYKARLRADGESVLFIEFGTGLRYRNEYQLRHGHYPGEYGDGRGAQRYGWFYRGSMGTNTPGDTEEAHKGRGVIHTYGSPANRVMYFTRVILGHRYRDTARRVYR